MPCRVWGDELEGLDCGQEAAEWFQKYLGVPEARLVYAAAALKKRELNKIASDRFYKMAKDGDNVCY